MAKTILFWVIAVHAMICSDPNRPFSILDDRIDDIGTKAIGIVGDVSIIDELLGIGVKAIEPAPIRPNPDTVISILQQRMDIVVGQAVAVIGKRPKDAKVKAVKSVQPVLSTKIHEPLVILEDAVRRVLREAVSDREMFKSWRLFSSLGRGRIFAGQAGGRRRSLCNAVSSGRGLNSSAELA